jgi:hypothetical protein
VGPRLPDLFLARFRVFKCGDLALDHDDHLGKWRPRLDYSIEGSFVRRNYERVASLEPVLEYWVRRLTQYQVLVLRRTRDGTKVTAPKLGANPDEGADCKRLDAPK